MRHAPGEAGLGPKPPDVTRQRQQIVQIEAELGTAIREIFSSRTTTQNAIYENLRQQLVDSTTEVHSLGAKEQALGAIRRHYEQLLLALPEKERRFGEVVRA